MQVRLHQPARGRAQKRREEGGAWGREGSNGPDCHVTEVADRWALGLDIWCLSSGVELEPLEDKASGRSRPLPRRRGKVATLEVRGSFPVSACKGRLLGGHNMPPMTRGLRSGIHFSKALARVLGEARGQAKCEKRNDNWPMVHKGPEGLSYEGFKSPRYYTPHSGHLLSSPGVYFCLASVFCLCVCVYFCVLVLLCGMQDSSWIRAQTQALAVKCWLLTTRQPGNLDKHAVSLCAVPLAVLCP